MLKEVYYLVVSGSTDREPIECESYPTEEEIKKAIKKAGGTTARIQLRYKLVEE
ncbi:hypothetical protein [Peribacillus frigoritolerans]|uniref:hypothetical protein n=1 Tax=Peribacillus frigoritolerans TaxID=450367 RepID=UPI003016C2CF